MSQRFHEAFLLNFMAFFSICVYSPEAVVNERLWDMTQSAMQYFKKLVEKSGAVVENFFSSADDLVALISVLVMNILYDNQKLLP